MYLEAYTGGRGNPAVSVTQQRLVIMDLAIDLTVIGLLFIGILLDEQYVQLVADVREVQIYNSLFLGRLELYFTCFDPVEPMAALNAAGEVKLQVFGLGVDSDIITW